MEKIKKFVREKALKKLVVVTGLLVAIWVNFIVFAAIAGKPFTLALAQSTIRVGLTVAPANPVEGTASVEKDSKKESKTDYKTSSYRLISTISDSNSTESGDVGTDTSNIEAPPPASVVRKSIVKFKGKAIYPNSEVFLVISSDKIYTSVTSDSQGEWTWTNLGYPLANGQHTIEASNISPYDLSGKRDVFFQKFSFWVDTSGNESGMAELPLESVPATGNQADGNDFGDKLRNSNLIDTYLFDIALLNKKEYNPGDEINMTLLFNPLGDVSNGDAKIRYEVYYYNESNSRETAVYNFEDDVDLSLSQAFLKRIKLKDDVQEGIYFIKVMAAIGEDKYVQSSRFSIAPKTLIQVGSTKIDEKKFSMAITWNVIFILGFAIIIFILIIFEYKKMSLCNLVDEDELRHGHYFSN